MDHRREFWAPRSKKGYRCADCGRTRQEAREIDVHHLTRDRGDHPDALVGLCRRCHLQARHRRSDVPGRSPLEPDRPTGLSPRSPRGLAP